MRLLRGILVTAGITLGVIALGVYWIAPVALSLDAARTARPATRVVPTDLKDLSVSQVPGTKISYFVYEFEIPWDDLDAGQTEQVPKDNPNPFMVALTFRSGSHLIVSASPVQVFQMGLVNGTKVAPESIEAAFGPHSMRSDYDFLKNVYEFTPDKMHLWALSPSVHYREMVLLTMKAIVLSGYSADTGIFNVQNQNYRGFQLGDPQAHPRMITVHLYSDEGSIELTFSANDPSGPAAITQPEINRIVQSLRKVPQNTPPAGN